MRKVYVEIPQTFIPTTHLCKSKSKNKNKNNECNTSTQTVDFFLCYASGEKSHKKTMEKGQGSEAAMACLNRVSEEYLRDLGTLVMVIRLQIRNAYQ